MRYARSPELAAQAYAEVAREHREAGETELAKRAEREFARLRAMIKEMTDEGIRLS